MDGWRSDSGFSDEHLSEARTVETCWIRTVIGFGFSVVNFATGGSFFVATSFVSPGSQKKVYLEDSDFRCRDVEDAVNFIGEVTSFVSLASGFQKKESSEMGFV